MYIENGDMAINYARQGKFLWMHGEIGANESRRVLARPAPLLLRRSIRCVAVSAIISGGFSRGRRGWFDFGWTTSFTFRLGFDVRRFLWFALGEGREGEREREEKE